MTEDARQDIQEISEYITEHDGLERALDVMDGLMTAANSLAEFPDHGHHPTGMPPARAKHFRQVAFKSWCLIYRVVGARVLVLLVADGRRDVQSVLKRRLLGA